MNDLVKPEQTMSSIEIAELTGKRHDHILRDIRNMFNSLKIEISPFLGASFDSMNRHQNIFNLPREECTILVSGYDIKLRAKIIRRWLELEAGIIPRSLPEALRLAADQAEKIEQLEAQRQLEAPHVSFSKTVEGTKAKINVGDFAKLSGKIGRNNLFKKMRESSILMQNNRPYQNYINSGYFEVSETVIKRTSGDQITFTTYITGKGQVWLSSKIEGWTR